MEGNRVIVYTDKSEIWKAKQVLLQVLPFLFPFSVFSSPPFLHSHLHPFFLRKGGWYGHPAGFVETGGTAAAVIVYYWLLFTRL